MNILTTLATPLLCPELAGTLLTPEEFDAVTDFDKDFGYELIKGVLVVTPLPLPAESAMNQRLGTWLENYAEQHPEGKVLDDTLPEQIVRTSNRRRADRLVWIGLGRVPRMEQDLPTLVIEFVSEARRDRTRDYIEKRQEYRDAGIPEYWIIDRFQRTLTVVRAKGEEVIAENAVYRPALLPGFELHLARLFAVADRHELANPGEAPETTPT